MKRKYSWVVEDAINNLQNTGKTNHEIAEKLGVENLYIKLTKQSKEVIEKYSTEDNWKSATELASELKINHILVTSLRGHHNLYMQKYTKKAKCLVCGVEFLKSCRQHKFCGESCAQKYRRKDYITRTKKCAFCGKIYSGRKTKYCSVTCYHKAQAKFKMKCLICGKDFVAESDERKYCSRKCYSIAQSNGLTLFLKKRYLDIYNEYLELKSNHSANRNL